jgi:hypothetical protein
VGKTREQNPHTRDAAPRTPLLMQRAMAAEGSSPSFCGSRCPQRGGTRAAATAYLMRLKLEVREVVQEAPPRPEHCGAPICHERSNDGSGHKRALTGEFGPGFKFLSAMRMRRLYISSSTMRCRRWSGVLASASLRE